MPTHPLDLTDDDLHRIDAALDALEQALGSLEGLGAAERMRAFKMGPKTEAFCRHALVLLEQRPDTVPPVFELERMRALMDRFDALRGCEVRLRRMDRLLADAMKRLGIEVAEKARTGYKAMRQTGDVAGLQPLEANFRARYRRVSRRNEPDAPPE